MNWKKINLPGEKEHEENSDMMKKSKAGFIGGYKRRNLGYVSINSFITNHIGISLFPSMSSGVYTKKE